MLNFITIVVLLGCMVYTVVAAGRSWKATTAPHKVNMNRVTLGAGGYRQLSYKAPYGAVDIPRPRGEATLSCSLLHFLLVAVACCIFPPSIIMIVYSLCNLFVLTPFQHCIFIGSMCYVST